MTGPDPSTGLIAATALHAGFQLVITTLIYPTFASSGDDRWPSYNAAYRRRITALVIVVYGLFAAAAGWILLVGPTPRGLSGQSA